MHHASHKFCLGSLRSQTVRKQTSTESDTIRFPFIGHHLNLLTTCTEHLVSSPPSILPPIMRSMCFQFTCTQNLCENLFKLWSQRRHRQTFVGSFAAQRTARRIRVHCTVSPFQKLRLPLSLCLSVSGLWLVLGSPCPGSLRTTKFFAMTVNICTCRCTCSFEVTTKTIVKHSFSS